MAGSHAIVIGASMGGLLAARALVGSYERVTVLDRDGLAEEGPRRGVPQGRHLHAVLPRCGAILEAMFPGLGAELTGAGAPLMTRWNQLHFVPGGHLFARVDHPVEPPILLVTRPYLEGRVRARVATLPGVTIAERTEVTGLLTSQRRDRVTGVQTRAGDTTSDLGADLVIDASGRTGRAPVWLDELGYGPVPETVLPVNVKYATQFFDIPDDELAPLALNIGATAALPRAALLGLMEGERWQATFAGFADHHPPLDDAGYLDFAASVLPPDVMAVLRRAKPLTEITGHHFPTSLRRRYERLRRFPDGLLVFGDAITSFNPIYGQGMAVAAMQAEALRACLRDRGDAELPRRFFRAAAKPVSVAWQLAGGADLAIPSVPGRGNPLTRGLNAYVDRVQTAAERDPEISNAFWQVASFMAPPPRLFAPDVLRAVITARRGSGTSKPASPATPLPSTLATLQPALLVDPAQRNASP